MAKKPVSLLLISGIIIFGGVFILSKINDRGPALTNLLPDSAMQITSNEFNNNENIPDKFTCKGDNVSPSLNFIDIPKDAKSLAVIVHDPDAPSGDWIHWLLWNIPATISGIAENKVPESAIAGTNDFNSTKYSGPCPPSGTHHYLFELFALNSMLELPETAKAKDLENAMNGHVLAKRTLTGLYSKQ